jgi:DNA repair photolyase
MVRSLDPLPSRFEFLQSRTFWREWPAPEPQYRCQAVIDPYQGCAYGCRYCFAAAEEVAEAAHPLDCRVGVKTNAAFLLNRELQRRGAPVSVLVGGASDPYQPAEERFRITRHCLEILIRFNCPVHVLTKSEGVLQDLDLLAPYSDRGAAVATVSLVGLRGGLTEWLEPHAASPARRLRLVSELNSRGVLCGVALAPLLPRLNDSPQDLREFFRAASSAGAAWVLPTAFRVEPDGPAAKNFLGALRDRQPELVPLYSRWGADAPEAASWRRGVWDTLRGLSELTHLPLHLPVDGASEADILPWPAWSEPVARA